MISAQSGVHRRRRARRASEQQRPDADRARLLRRRRRQRQRWRLCWRRRRRQRRWRGACADQRRRVHVRNHRHNNKRPLQQHAAATTATSHSAARPPRRPHSAAQVSYMLSHPLGVVRMTRRHVSARRRIRSRSTARRDRAEIALGSRAEIRAEIAPEYAPRSATPPGQPRQSRRISRRINLVRGGAGVPLAASADGSLPPMMGKAMPAGAPLSLPPLTALIAVFPNARAAACANQRQSY